MGLIEHPGEEPYDRPFLGGKAALVLCKAGVLLHEQHIVEDGPALFAPPACPVWITIRNLASVAVQPERSEDWNKSSGQVINR